MKKSLIKMMMLAACSIFSLTACGGDDNGGGSSKGDDGDNQNPTEKPTEKPTETVTFAKGADISWVTEMEKSGMKFYNANGKQTDCFELMKELGMNAIRLRVWVNPTDGYCNKADVVAKALRAKAQGLALMVDFHYSDSWADPGKQNIPNAWKNYGLAKMKTAVADHTKEVLQALKDKDIDVQWVQIGNETTSGMLWPMGEAKGNDFANYVSLNNAGYDATKSIYPDALCIVHIDRGQELTHLTWMFNGLKNNGAKWDVIGLSLYPTDSSWKNDTDNCLANMSTLATTYGKKVMLCEIGMPWDSNNAAAVTKKMVDGCKNIKQCLGVFYWEPEAYNGWKSYSLGAFDTSGKPTAAMNAFK